MRPVFISIVAILLGGAVGHADDIEALKKKVADLEFRTSPLCTVSVAVDKGGGSGTVVAAEGGRSLVLTNRHVAEDSFQYFALTGGQKYPGKLVAINPKGSPDLAAFAVDVELPKAAVAATEPPVGAPLRHWGRASGPQRGKVTGYTPAYHEGSSQLIYTMNDDMLTVPGDSGAGIFNDDGQLVGVNYARSIVPGDPFGVQQAVWLGDIKAFLKALPAGQFPKLVASLK